MLLCCRLRSGIALKDRIRQTFGVVSGISPDEASVWPFRLTDTLIEVSWSMLAFEFREWSIRTSCSEPDPHTDPSSSTSVGFTLDGASLSCMRGDDGSVSGDFPLSSSPMRPLVVGGMVAAVASILCSVSIVAVAVAVTNTLVDIAKAGVSSSAFLLPFFLLFSQRKLNIGGIYYIKDLY